MQDGLSNWNEQNERIRNYEKTKTHKDAKVAEVLFKEGLDIKSLLDQQSKEREEKRIKDVKMNREIVKRIIDAILFLGKQGLAFRGHNENMAKNSDLNNGNFLELLQLLAKYDSVTDIHVDSVRTNRERQTRRRERRR